MAGGRKDKLIARQPATPSSSVALARNIPKNELGGVVFGCKHTTFGECLSKELFGLPSTHFPYVMNIEPGLPLFLFNYSDRKMHGIYEAASHGQLNIDPYAWTKGAARTSFPAQVRVLMRIRCQPLGEEQFKKAIEDNYYRANHFYFELDHAQTNKLISLFTLSFHSDNIPVAPVMSSKVNLFPTSPVTKWKTISKVEKVDTRPGELTEKITSSSNLENVDSLVSLSSDDGEKENTDLNKSSPTVRKEKKFKELDQAATCDVRAENLQHSGVCGGVENEEGKILFKLEKLHSNRVQESPPSEGYVNASTSTIPCEDSKHPAEEDPFDLAHMKRTSTSDPYHENTELLQIIKKLDDRTTVMEKKQVASELEIQQLKNVVRDSERTIQYLRDRIAKLETELNPSPLVDDTQSISVERSLGLEKVFYLIGGYDGTSWLSALHCFSTSQDILIPRKSMSNARGYACAVGLGDNLYVFGGGDGDSWYNSVECYNQSNDEWTLCPPLSRAKGHLGGATLDSKIFAVGGGDGVESFSDVEMFDPALGRWLNHQSMLQKRCAPAAAEFHGSLFAVGGFHGNCYLKSAEIYDPRIGCWTWIAGMKMRRCAHSLSVLGDKLYAIGGYDGETMVPSVEIFDPRLGSWMMGEPMNASRGSAGSVVIGDCILVIGGACDIRNQNMRDGVECYEEGKGWTVTGLQAIGKRSCFSAVVL